MDAESLVGVVNERCGYGLTLVGEAEHGETSGAVYVRWPGGREGVITRTNRPLERMQQTAEVMDSLHGRGLPVPRQEPVQLDDGYWRVLVLQERLPGSPPKVANAAVIEAMLAMSEHFTDALADRPDVPRRPLWLQRGSPDYPRHDLLAGYDARTRRMLDLIREVGHDGPDELAGDDLVHPDYTPPNVLFDRGGQISGIVDWNGGVARGDRCFALVGLRADLTLGAWMQATNPQVHQEAIDRLDEYLTRVLDPTLMRRYWAHCTLHRLHWTITFNDAEAIAMGIRLGNLYLR
ncbi:phosphotransferase [Actinopolymorpha pittospori]